LTTKGIFFERVRVALFTVKGRRTR